jgi:RNA polymerase sigma factor (sigma-70 family)
VIAATARRHRLSAEEAEEFAAIVHLRLVSDEYAVLRKFGGRCALRTFLAVVIRRMCLDFRAAQWGKWRPSMRSRRGGEVAVLLERLTIRDGLTFDEACSVLQINHGLTPERDSLAQLYACIEGNGRRRRAREVELDELPTLDYSPDGPLIETEHERALTRAAAALGRALSAMDPSDRRILQLRYAERITVADIAATLGVNQKWVFRRLDRLSAMLRARLEADGLQAEMVLPAIGRARGNDADVLRAAAPRQLRDRLPASSDGAPISSHYRNSSREWARRHSSKTARAIAMADPASPAAVHAAG